MGEPIATQGITAVEKLNYSASLVTDSQAIDPLLDRFRIITSRAGFDPTHLSDEDAQTIAKLQQEVETYLVTKERLRQFTAESLRLQIEQHMSGNADTISRTRLLVVIALSSVIAIGLGAFLPLQHIEQRVQVGGAVAFSLLHMGAAWLFLTALAAFKSNLRRAFLLMCVAVTLIGLSLLAHPIVELFELRQYWLTSLLLPLPLVLAAIIFQFGVVKYARQVGITGQGTTARPVIIACVLVALTTWLAPHQAVSEPEIVFDLAAIMWGWVLVMPVAAAILLPSVVRTLPDLYKPSARALLYAMWAITAVVGYQYGLRVLAGPFMNGPISYGLFVLVIIMGVMLLRTGYLFSKVKQY